MLKNLLHLCNMLGMRIDFLNYLLANAVLYCCVLRHYTTSTETR